MYRGEIPAGHRARAAPDRHQARRGRREGGRVRRRPRVHGQGQRPGQARRHGAVPQPVHQGDRAGPRVEHDPGPGDSLRERARDQDQADKLHLQHRPEPLGAGDRERPAGGPRDRAARERLRVGHASRIGRPETPRATSRSVSTEGVPIAHQRARAGRASSSSARSTSSRASTASGIVDHHRGPAGGDKVPRGLRVPGRRRDNRGPQGPGAAGAHAARARFQGGSREGVVVARLLRTLDGASALRPRQLRRDDPDEGHRQRQAEALQGRHEGRRAGRRRTRSTRSKLSTYQRSPPSTRTSAVGFIELWGLQSRIAANAIGFSGGIKGRTQSEQHTKRKQSQALKQEGKRLHLLGQLRRPTEPSTS